MEQGSLLLLQFTAFDIQLIHSPDGLSACDDHLTITDGDGTTLMEKSCGPDINGSILVGNKMSGSFLPVPVRSRSNIVNLMFSSDGGRVGDTWGGWSLGWSAVTPGIFMCSTATAHMGSSAQDGENEQYLS